MDGSSLGLMDDLDHITLGDNEATDFSMRALNLTETNRVNLKGASVSHGIKRSISNAVERNLNTAPMDLFEVKKKGLGIFIAKEKISLYKYLLFASHRPSSSALHKLIKKHFLEAFRSV